MKEKVFRERYGLVEDKTAGSIKIPVITKEKEELEDKKPVKKGRKNVKSSK